ncbi:hypothetical protein V6N13_017130 [Hibiscus sabdariffa]
MLQPITPGMSVLPGYMEWFYENGKPFIMTREARARVLRVPRPERPRQERGPRPTGAGGPSAEPYTPMPTLFNHASSSQFQPQFTPMPPPTEGFFTGAFQPYSSMMAAPSHSPGHFYPPPLSVYPPQGPTFGSSSSYGMVQQTLQVLYLPLDRVGAVITLMRVRRTTTILNHLFEEIPTEMVVLQIVGRGDIGGIRLICLNMFLFVHVGLIFLVLFLNVGRI